MPLKNKTEVADIELRTKTQASATPCRPDTTDLRAWATGLAAQGLELDRPVSYLEAPLRPIKTERVSSTAGHYIEAIKFARSMGIGEGWGIWTSGWYREREAEAWTALIAFREAVIKALEQGAKFVKPREECPVCKEDIPPDRHYYCSDKCVDADQDSRGEAGGAG